MIKISRTDEFAAWLSSLADEKARAKIAVRIDRLAYGNPGDVKPIGGGVSEMRINYGPGYRVYYKGVSKALIVLLAGGDKKTQARDIKTAISLADALKE